MRPDLLRPDVIQALQSAAQAKGMKVVAAEMDMAPSSLYAALNPYGDRSVSKCGLELALGIMAYTGDKTALAIMAGELGCTLAERREPDKPTVAQESLQDFAAVNRLAQAMEQGASEAEVHRLLAEAQTELGQTVSLYVAEKRKKEW